MNGSLFLSRSVASLTNDDSKILGNIRPKLKKLEEQYNLQSNKFKTLNSSWTPLVNRSANKTVFEERVDLASHWFDLWNDKQRKWFLLNLFSRLRPPQICYMEEIFESFGIYERRDFTRTLPTNLSKHIFSFLSPKDLSRCAQVSSHWKQLSEHDDVWKPKAMKFGWYLPYEPFRREVGAWKAHYIECVCSINAQPLSKEDAFKYREVLYKRELTTAEKEKLIYSQTKRSLDEWENYELRSARKPWQHSSLKPTELRKSDKLLYSYPINSNVPSEANPLNSAYVTQFGLPLKSAKPHLRNLSNSKSITGHMLDDLRQSLPLHVSNIKESYKSMRKSEADFFATKLSSVSTMSFLNQSKSQMNTTLNSDRITTGKFGVSLTPEQVSFSNENPHVIFISSKAPCCHLLLECLKVKIIVIPYDFESTNIGTLIKLLDAALKGRLAKSIGLFLHFEKPGQICLTQDSTIYKTNVNNDENSNFITQLKDYLCVEQSPNIDIFLPLGSSVDGLELVNKIQELVDINVRIPCGYLSNYAHLKSQWLNSDLKAPPTLEYFVESKLDIWLNYCDTLQDAHTKICEKVLNGYSNEIDNAVLKKIAGKIVFDSLSSTSFLTDLNVQRELAKKIAKSARINSESFFQTLANELSKSSDNEPPVNSDEDKFKSSLDFAADNVMRSDLALKSFLRYRSNTEGLEPGLRIQIALELTKSEINYMKRLEMVQKFYARPVKGSLNAGRKIVSQSVIDLLFNDLAIIYNLSKDIVKDLNQRIKNWQVDCCIADVLNKLTNSLQSYINYANNYDTILSTIDKLVTSNPKFRAFLSSADRMSGLATLQDLMQSPWTRIKDYMNILGSLQLHTPHNHPDQATITENIKRIREVYLFIKQLQDRLNNQHEMIELQRTIMGAPMFMKDGRYLILRQPAMLLNKLTYAYVKDLTCFLFNDAILLAYRIKKHFPFTKYAEESLIYYDMIGDLLNMTISEVTDYKHLLNVVHLQFNKYDEFYLAFDTYEAKYNFLKSLKLASQLAVHQN